MSKNRDSTEILVMDFLNELLIKHVLIIQFESSIYRDHYISNTYITNVNYGVDYFDFFRRESILDTIILPLLMQFDQSFEIFFGKSYFRLSMS